MSLSHAEIKAAAEFARHHQVGRWQVKKVFSFVPRQCAYTNKYTRMFSNIYKIERVRPHPTPLSKQEVILERFWMDSKSYLMLLLKGNLNEWLEENTNGNVDASDLIENMQVLYGDK